jgi:hypothetical protein
MAGKLQIEPKVPREFPKTASLPAPKRFLVQDSPTNPRGGLAFFEYWKEVAGTKNDPKPAAELVTVKFYLHIPVVTYKMVDPSRKNAIFKQIEGPLWFEDPEDYETEVPKLLGAARWHVLLNEAGVHGHLMHAYFAAGSWDDYPLTIDLNTLVRTEPKNADYIQWLKKNKIKTPWDNPEDEDEMQAGDVLKVVVDGMRETNQVVREKTEELADVKLQAVQEELERTREEQADRGDVRLNAQNEGIKLVTEVSRESSNAALAMARDMVAMSREGQNAHVNPIEILKAAVDLVKPKEDSGLGIFIEAMKDQNAKMLAMQESNQEFMRSVIGMRKGADGTWTAGDSQQQPGGLEVELARFERIGSLLGWARPGAMTQQRDDRSEPQIQHPPEKSFWAAVAENPAPVISGVSMIVTLICNAIYNLKSEPSKTISPQEALRKAQAQEPQPIQQAAQSQVKLDPKDPKNWLGLAQDMHQRGHFKAHFLGKDNGLDGYTFAEFILTERTGGAKTELGRKTFNSIKENLGFQGFDQMIRMSPLWDICKDTPEQYHKFLTEFFTYDEMVEAQNQAEGVKAS